MKVVRCGDSVVIAGTREEIREWEEQHPEYSIWHNFNSSKYLYKVDTRNNNFIGSIYKANKKEQCLRRAAMAINSYKLYGK